MADELAGKAVRCSPAEQRGCDVGVEDDEAPAMSARRDSKRSAMNSSYSSSDSNGSSGAARSSTDTAYRWFREGKLPVPARRAGRLILVEPPAAIAASKVVV